MRYLIIILTSLILVGCTAFDQHPYWNDKNSRSAKYIAKASYGIKTVLTNEVINYTGYSNISMDDAKKNAIQICEELKKLDSYRTDLIKKNSCEVTDAYLNPSLPENQEELKKITEQKKKEAQQAEIKSEQRKLENE